MKAAPGSLRTRPPAAETVPFADLSSQWRQIEAGAMSDLRKLFETSAFVLGPFVERFERAAAEFLGVAHAVGVNSGTSALHLALIAAGIGPGDKVLLPANTFIATAWSVLYVGAEPVLCNVEPASLDDRPCGRGTAPERRGQGHNSGASLRPAGRYGSGHVVRGAGTASSSSRTPPRLSARVAATAMQAAWGGSAASASIRPRASGRPARAA